MKKRLPSTRTDLREIVNGYYVKGEEDFAPNYLITENYKKIYRAKIVATVFNDPFISEDESYGRILLDDAKETIWAYFFRENTVLLRNISKGDMVQVVGKIYELRNEKQLNVEAICKVSPNFWSLHRLEVIRNNKIQEEQVTKAEKIKSEEKNLKKAKEKAESMGINPEIIEAMYEMEYTKEKEIDTALIKDKVLSAIDEGETFGLVGESGCGKSVTALSIIKLIPDPPGKIIGGEVRLEGEDLLKKSENEMQKIRGNKISMIFQEPMTSLDPVFTIGSELIETIQLHQGVEKEEAEKKAIEMLRVVGIPEPEKRMKEYPHQLSGGMRQRAMIAMALSCNPKLLIADEPTTALDVTIQAQILRLMDKLKEEFSAAVLLITHDLGVIAETCKNVGVMYAGKIVEYGSVEDIFENPLHPYTVGLNRAIPRLDVDTEKLQIIEGNVPDLIDMPSGCKFHPRCPYAMDICREKEPPLKEREKNHFARCYLEEIP